MLLDRYTAQSHPRQCVLSSLARHLPLAFSDQMVPDKPLGSIWWLARKGEWRLRCKASRLTVDRGILRWPWPRSNRRTPPIQGNSKITCWPFWYSDGFICLCRSRHQSCANRCTYVQDSPLFSGELVKLKNNVPWCKFCNFGAWNVSASRVFRHSLMGRSIMVMHLFLVQ